MDLTLKTLSEENKMFVPDMMLQLKQFDSLTASLKSELEQLITNQSIPLDIRWDVWVKASPALKNSEWGSHSISALPEDFIAYDGEIHTERYETVSTMGIIEKLQEGGYCPETEEPVPYEVSHGIDINAVKEEILSKNLGSFVYD